MNLFVFLIEFKIVFLLIGEIVFKLIILIEIFFVLINLIVFLILCMIEFYVIIVIFVFCLVIFVLLIGILYIFVGIFCLLVLYIFLGFKKIIGFGLLIVVSNKFFVLYGVEGVIIFKFGIELNKIFNVLEWCFNVWILLLCGKCNIIGIVNCLWFLLCICVVCVIKFV